MSQNRRGFLKRTAAGLGAAASSAYRAWPEPQGQKLVEWWNNGYYPEQDAAK